MHECINLPKPLGKEVRLTNDALFQKYNLLSFTEENNKIIETNMDAQLKIIQNTNLLDVTNTAKTTRDLTSGEFWSNATREVKNEDQSAKASVNGYESESYLYFDVNRQTKGIKDDSKYAINNGKYMIAKSEPNHYSLNKISEHFYVQTYEPSFSSAFGNFSIDLIFELNSYNYRELKFYEDDNYFTISLKSDLKTIKKQTPEISQVFGKYFRTKDSSLKSFNYNLVLVFENNAIISAGAEYKYETVYKTENQYLYELNQNNASTKYIDKAPKAANPNQYELIQDLREVKK